MMAKKSELEKVRGIVKRRIERETEKEDEESVSFWEDIAFFLENYKFRMVWGLPNNTNFLNNVRRLLRVDEKPSHKDRNREWFGTRIEKIWFVETPQQRYFLRYSKRVERKPPD